jgi:hypothetical protein
MSTRIYLPADRGRWVRRGGSIVLLPGGVGPGGGVEGEFGGRRPPPRPRPAAAYTVCDFIDPRIDVAAQYALFGLLSGPGRAVALAMLAAVKAGTLGGIFQEDQQAPALRARGLGTNWWTLIPKGAGAFCAPGTPPLISFRKSLANNRAALGAALLAVFPGCGVPLLPAPPPSGRVCTRPSPKPGSLIVLPPEVKLDTAGTIAGRVTGSFTVQSTSGSVRWEIRSKPAWMTFTPGAGTATPVPTQVAVTVDPSGLAKGTNGTNVWLNPASGGNVDVWIEVFVR